jgi:outer membrane lipoprotein-sorting protein
MILRAPEPINQFETGKKTPMLNISSPFLFFSFVCILLNHSDSCQGTILASKHNQQSKNLERSHTALRDQNNQNHGLLQKAQNYFDQLHTMKASFEQINHDGSLSQGNIFMKRPGRLRLQYYPPHTHMVIAHHGTLTTHDPKTEETTEFPLDSTPAGLILNTKIRLEKDAIIWGESHDNYIYRLSLKKKDDPDAGTLTLIFNIHPQWSLQQWIIEDAQDHKTIVNLKDIQMNVQIPDILFEFNKRQE